MSTIEVQTSPEVEETPLFPPEVELAVEAGWRFLDEKLGVGWWAEIKCDILDLSNECRCVLGQIYAAYDDNGYAFACDELGLNPCKGAVIDLGFYAPNNGRGTTYAQLTAAWKHRLHCEKAGA